MASYVMSAIPPDFPIVLSQGTMLLFRYPHHGYKYEVAWLAKAHTKRMLHTLQVEDE